MYGEGKETSWTKPQTMVSDHGWPLVPQPFIRPRTAADGER